LPQDDFLKKSERFNFSLYKFNRYKRIYHKLLVRTLVVNCTLMPDPKYFPALTGTRAVAAFMVYIFHFNPFIPEKFGNSIFSFFDQFNAGVPVFFVLSGFLIAARYEDSVEANSTWLKQYLLKRFARIYPIYFLLTTITFVIFWLDFFPLPRNTSPSEYNSFILYLLNISFLKGFFDLFKNTGLPQSWSLTVEECFYLCASVHLFSFY